MKLAFLPPNAHAPRCQGLVDGFTQCRRNAVLHCDDGHVMCKAHGMTDKGVPEVACLICVAAEMLMEPGDPEKLLTA